MAEPAGLGLGHRRWGGDVLTGLWVQRRPDEVEAGMEIGAGARQRVGGCRHSRRRDWGEGGDRS